MPCRDHPGRAGRHPHRPVGQAATVDAVVDQALVRSLGAVPLLLPLCAHLGLREVVNRRCYPEGTGPEEIDVGRSVLVLILNRLVAPQPLVHVETWLAQTVLPDLLDVDAAQCNDDRLARTLDTVLPHADEIWQDLVVAAITTFDLDLRYLCYDLTSISFCGAYEEAELVRYGYSRDHRPDRKQTEIAAIVTAAGGVPLDYRALAGNVADRTTPVEALHRLRHLLALLPARDPTAACVVISDRAMLTDAALAAYARSTLSYLGPLDPGLGHGVVQELLASVSADELAAHPLPYRPQRAADDPDWVAYQGVERLLHVPHPDPTQPPVEVRALVVWSPGKARLDAQMRLTHLLRLERTLHHLAGKLGRRPYTTATAVQKRIAALLKGHPARRFVQVDLTGGPEADRPLTLTWTRNEIALAEAATLDGRYVLGTNAPDLDAATMLARSKQRDVSEKRFALVKGPLAVRPVYVHKEERVLGLVFCTLVALLLFALLEVLIRRAGLPLSGSQFLAQCAALAVVLLILRDGTTLRYLTGLAPPMTRLVEALGWPPVDHYVQPLSIT